MVIKFEKDLKSFNKNCKNEINFGLFLGYTYLF